MGQMKKVTIHLFAGEGAWNEEFSVYRNAEAVAKLTRVEVDGNEYRIAEQKEVDGVLNLYLHRVKESVVVVKFEHEEYRFKANDFRTVSEGLQVRKKNGCNHVPKKRLGWQKNRLKASGITVSISNKAIVLPESVELTEVNNEDLNTLRRYGFTVSKSLGL